MFKFAFAAVAAAALAGSASAAISIGPTVADIATFTDSTTGRNWAKLNTYFDKSYDFMAGDLGERGFTYATREDLEALFASFDVSADFAGSAAIMGKAPNRDLIWGAYSPLNQDNTIKWYYTAGFGWAVEENTNFLANQVPNGGTDDADMNFWAYVAGAGAVPEPASWAMLIAGFGLVGAAARRRRAIAA